MNSTSLHVESILMLKVHLDEALRNITINATYTIFTFFNVYLKMFLAVFSFKQVDHVTSSSFVL